MNISFEEGLAVLEALARGNCPSTVDQLRFQTRFNKDTVQETLKILEMARYVSVSDGSSRISLSPKLWSLGFCMKNPSDLKRAADRHLSELAMKTRESACVAVIADQEIVFAAGINVPEPTVAEFAVGTKIPAHACAVGKAILAFQPPRVISDVAESLLVAAPANRDPGAFRRELEEIRSRGYATHFDEVGGMNCEMAAPIRCADGVIEAAVGISGSSSRLTPDAIPALAEHILEAAEGISRELKFAKAETTRRA